jgi:hypothetical protein
MAAYQQHTEVSSDLLPSCGDPSNLVLRMTSSVTSSLTSPVDSGVALLDSDADNTSVSEATMNETDCLSLRDDKEVSVSVSVVGPSDRCTCGLEQGTGPLGATETYILDHGKWVLNFYWKP